MTDKNTPNADLTDSEKLDAILRRLDALESQGDRGGHESRPTHVVNRRPKAYFAVFFYLVGTTIVTLVTQYIYRDAIELFEDGVEFKIVMAVMSAPWVFGVIVLYRVFFGAEGRRRVFYAICLSGFLPMALLYSYWWGALVAFGAMAAAIVAGEKYVGRGARGGQS